MLKSKTEIQNSKGNMYAWEKDIIPGEGFGELAIMNKVTRSATIAAKENCYCLTL